MKTVLILRHAKSSWDDASLADFDRPLAPRGIEAAKRMGREIARRGWLPDEVLSSPAIRTRQTWDLVSTGWKNAPAVKFVDRLYEASANTILSEVKRTAVATETLLVIGHNPGMEDLARQLAGDNSNPGSSAELREKFPTAALARFSFEGGWDDLRPNSAELTHFLRPKELD